MAVARRVIWMTDEEWLLLKQIAKDRDDTISGVLRDFWTTASRATENADRDSTYVSGAVKRIAELEEEVRRLKVELAGRPAYGQFVGEGHDRVLDLTRRTPVDRPFGSPRPAPKTTRKK